MKIYLGTLGSESLITAEDRELTRDTIENKDDLITEDFSLRRYYNASVKSKELFELRWSFITNTNLNIIRSEYLKHTELNLKLETVTPDSYDEYTVMFISTLPNKLFKDLDGGRRYFTNIKIKLREV